MALLRSARPKLVAAFDSSARSELALRIIDRDSAQAEASKLEGARASLERARSDAFQAIDAAEAGLATARTDASAHLLAEASGTAGKAPPSVREARLALADAEDRRDAAQAALAGLGAQEQSAALRLDITEREVRASARAVMRESPDLPRLLGRIDELRRELHGVAAQLAWLTHSGIIQVERELGEDLVHTPLVDAARAVTRRLETSVNAWFEFLPAGQLGPIRDAASPVWAEAFAGLHRDANTPLPQVQL